MESRWYGLGTQLPEPLKKILLLFRVLFALLHSRFNCGELILFNLMSALDYFSFLEIFIKIYCGSVSSHGGVYGFGVYLI